MLSLERERAKSFAFIFQNPELEALEALEEALLHLEAQAANPLARRCEDYLKEDADVH